MEIQTRVKGQVCILDLTGPLLFGDGDAQLRQRVADLLSAGERRFVFSLRAVPTIDSAGVGEIIACHKRIREQDGDVALVLSPRAHEVFVLARLNLVFPIFEDTDSAAASFR